MSEHWQETCPNCGRNLFQMMHDKLIDCGTEFEVKCDGCGVHFDVLVEMVPEFCLTRQSKVEQ